MTKIKHASDAGLLALGAAAMALLCNGVRADEPRIKCDFSSVRKAPVPQGPALEAVVKGAMTEVPLNSVQYIDKAITRKVLVQRLYARRSETDTVEVIARLVNCTDYPLQVEGRTAFMDAEQIPTEPTSAWQRVFLPPRAMGVYREISTATQSVANFLVELREGR